MRGKGTGEGDKKQQNHAFNMGGRSSRVHKRYQHAKRPPAHGQQALAFCRDHSTPRQIIEQPRLEWVQRALLVAEGVGLALPLRPALPPHKSSYVPLSGSPLFRVGFREERH